MAVKIQIRRGTDAQRRTVVFSDGEPVFATDTKKLYVGDGTTIGGVEVTSTSTGDGTTTVDNASVLIKGIVKLSYDPSDPNNPIAMAANDPRIASYTQHVSNTNGNPHGMTASMIGAQPMLGYTPENAANKGSANGYPSLDATGKIPINQLPQFANAEIYVVSDQNAMLNLTAKRGDMAVRTADSRTFVLRTEPALTLGNWVEVLTPGSAGVTAFGNLTDVLLSGTPTDKQFSVYNGIAGKWTNVSVTPAFIGAQPALGFTAENSAFKGIANGYASLDGTAKIPLTQIPVSSIIGTTNPADIEMKANKGIPFGYASLDGGGKIPANQLPDLALTSVQVVANESSMLGLSNVQVGDVVVRTDITKTFILAATPASSLSNWQEILTPTAVSGSALSGMVDVSVAGMSNNQSLVYSSTMNKWINKTLTAADLGIVNTSTLDGLTDVTLAFPSNKQVVSYDTSLGYWKNYSLTASDVGAEPVGAVSTHIANYNHPTFSDVSGSTGISVTGTTTKSIAVVPNTTVQKVEVGYNGTTIASRKNINFIQGTGVTMTVADNATFDRMDVTINSTATGGATYLDALTDVTLNATTNNQVLAFDSIGSVWKNKSFNASDVGADPVGTATNLIGTHNTTYDHTKIHSHVQGTGIQIAGTTSQTISVVDNTTNQRVRVSKDGTVTGTRKEINLIPGTNVSIVAADNATNDRVDVTINASASGGGIQRYIIHTSATGNSYVTATGPGVTLTKTDTEATFIVPAGVEILSASIHLEPTIGTEYFFNLGNNTGMGDNSTFANLYCPQFQAFRDTGSTSRVSIVPTGYLDTLGKLKLAGFTGGTNGYWVNLSF